LFSGSTPVTKISTEEDIAKGAAIMGAFLNKQLDQLTSGFSDLIDFVPHSLGTNSFEGYFTEIIPKGASIPCTYTKIF